MIAGQELRFTRNVELRATAKGLAGYAVVYNSPSHQIPGIGIERIIPNAFQRSLDAAAAGAMSLALLAEHDERFLLADTMNGTLRLSSDTRGVEFDATLPTKKPTFMERILDFVRRKKLAGMSFSMSVNRDRRNSAGEREVIDADLAHISAVSNPAYPATSLEERMAVKEYRSIGEYFDGTPPARQGGADWRPYKPVFPRPYAELSREQQDIEDQHLRSYRWR